MPTAAASGPSNRMLTPTAPTAGVADDQADAAGTGACPASPAPASPSGCLPPMRAASKGAPAALADAPELVHGTCVALGTRRCPAAGPSGSRQVRSRAPLPVPGAARPGRRGGPDPGRRRSGRAGPQRASASSPGPPDTIRGKIEVRGVGIVEVKSPGGGGAGAGRRPGAGNGGRRAAARRRCHDPAAGRRGAAGCALFPWEASAPDQARRGPGARETRV